jgi:hypothetical protein
MGLGRRVSRPYGTRRRVRVRLRRPLWRGRLGSAAHHCDGLARYRELPQVALKTDSAGGTGIKDQKLTIIVSMIC